jgi:hypothetical protein
MSSGMPYRYYQSELFRLLEVVSLVGVCGVDTSTAGFAQRPGEACAHRPLQLVKGRRA